MSSNLPLVYFNGIVKFNFSIFGTGYQRILPLPNGYLVRGSYGNKIEIWDIERRIIKRNLPSSYSYPYILGLLSNGDLVAGYKTNSVIQIWYLKVANSESVKRTFHTYEICRCLTVLKNDDLAIGQSGNGFDIIIRSSQKGNLNGSGSKKQVLK
ncbi:unnamed protein product [Brachionus calyciflorus]|uniref:Uncharacterized protein n=1 Tax=Brachionus calyciflorus TaxID=104777 RepID=A0A813VJR6_9BILA|nr:unnamed protein product [Brachionus calyciflorus]